MYLQVALIKLLVCLEDECMLLTSSVLSLRENVLHNFHILYLLITANGLQNNSIKL